MSLYNSSVIINAPKELVFRTVSDISSFSEAVPDIVEVEFLTKQQSGAGTRFRETREMRGKKATTELEVTEFVENEHVRLVSEAGGTVWDSVFRVMDKNGNTELTLQMEARPKNIIARMMNVFIKGMISKALDKDMAAVKNYCETQK